METMAPSWTLAEIDALLLDPWEELGSADATCSSSEEPEAGGSSEDDLRKDAAREKRMQRNREAAAALRLESNIKKAERMRRNRASAAASRKRKTDLVRALEHRCQRAEMDARILRDEMRAIEATDPLDLLLQV